MCSRLHCILPPSYINILDVGCGSFIPEHLLRFSSISYYLGCDPDPVGLKKTRVALADCRFASAELINCGASDKNSSQFLSVQSKRTGSFISNSATSSSIAAKLVKTSELQKSYKNGAANVVKIDAEGHELQVIEGLDLSDRYLHSVEVEVSLHKNEKLYEFFNKLETNGFFLASLRHHNEQTVSSSTIKSKYLKKLYSFSGLLGINKYFDIWTNLSGSESMTSNKSFLSQLELVFIRKPIGLDDELTFSYIRVLMMYGFTREAYALAKKRLDISLPMWYRLPLIFPNR